MIMNHTQEPSIEHQKINTDDESFDLTNKIDLVRN